MKAIEREEGESRGMVWNECSGREADQCECVHPQ